MARETNKPGSHSEGNLRVPPIPFQPSSQTPETLGHLAPADTHQLHFTPLPHSPTARSHFSAVQWTDQILLDSGSGSVPRPAPPFCLDLTGPSAGSPPQNPGPTDFQSHLSLYSLHLELHLVYVESEPHIFWAEYWIACHCFSPLSSHISRQEKSLCHH